MPNASISVTPIFFSTSMKLVYLIYLLEKKYDIVFSEDDIDNVSMYTINGLSEIVSEHLN